MYHYLHIYFFQVKFGVFLDPQSACMLIDYFIQKEDYSGINHLLLISTELGPGPEVIKLFSCSPQLSMKFKQLINIEIAKITGIVKFKFPKQVIYLASKC